MDCFHPIVLSLQQLSRRVKQFPKQLHCDQKISSSCLKKFHPVPHLIGWSITNTLLTLTGLSSDPDPQAQPANSIEELHIFKQLLHPKGTPSSSFLPVFPKKPAFIHDRTPFFSPSDAPWVPNATHMLLL